MLRRVSALAFLGSGLLSLGFKAYNSCAFSAASTL